ncbi:hypothetical protein GS597_19010 [Synechococcales cyanobacterium C]|uniref:Uncharacterized protein n=1 Tax=Petrachloros mirabilis ULC683 TaxID=2781853 RepID=A0A8K2A9U6_9CYAN|nr:hypothetical protein [Petrachloros mirabilis]NCJ08560.1 hypothetical protein [Petrachloros mirabilis ULC683]
MKDDPIVEEIRQIREAYAARFNYNLKAIYQDLKRLEQKNPRPHRRRLPKRIMEGEVVNR